jgi:hypothetical protein
MKESFNLNPEHSSEPSPKDHSAKSNLKSFGVGAVATIASLGISEDAVAQQEGLLGRIKDKIKDKIEMVGQGQRHQENKQSVEPKMKKDSIFYNNSNDHTGFKYPFDKEYKSDENFYRTIAYAHSFTLDGAYEDAFFIALTKLKEENNLSEVSFLSIIEEKYFKNKETGIITSVMAIKMPRSEESKKLQGQETKFIGGVKDKDGIQYPFSKVYESDKDFYRVMAVGTGYDDRSITENVAGGVALDKIHAIIAEELKMNGEFLHLEMHPKTIVSRYDRNIKTGIYTSYIVLEVPRSNVKIEKLNPETKNTENNESKEINIPWEGDKIGFKYPFNKEYKSDEKFYRVVACASDYTIEKAKRKATMIALSKKDNDKQKITGWNLIDDRYQEDAKTGLITFAVVFEATKIPESEIIKNDDSKEINIPGKIIDNKQVGKDNLESKENINKIEGIRQVEIKDIKDLKNLLKDYNQVLSSSPYETKISSIMQEILNNDLRVVVAESNAKTINIAQVLLENKFDLLESSSGIISYKRNGDFGGGIIFYKELPGNSRKVMLLKLYKKSSSDNNINPTENLSKPLNKENKINLPEPSPVSNKPEKQPEYVKPTPENTANFMEERQKQLDAFEKSRQEEFEKFKNSREDK